MPYVTSSLSYRHRLYASVSCACILGLQVPSPVLIDEKPAKRAHTGADQRTRTSLRAE